MYSYQAEWKLACIPWNVQLVNILYGMFQIGPVGFLLIQVNPLVQ